jgi:hypothetical protein
VIWPWLAQAVAENSLRGQAPILLDGNFVMVVICCRLLTVLMGTIGIFHDFEPRPRERDWLNRLNLRVDGCDPCLRRRGCRRAGPSSQDNMINLFMIKCEIYFHKIRPW